MRHSVFFLNWLIVPLGFFSSSCLGMEDDQLSSHTSRYSLKEGEVIHKHGASSSKSSQKSGQRGRKPIVNEGKEEKSDLSNKEGLIVPGKEGEKEEKPLEEEFSKKFPINYLKDSYDSSFFVGQIIKDPADFNPPNANKMEANESNNNYERYLSIAAQGDASGIIIKIENRPDGLRATGVTALHVFAEREFLGGLSIKHLRRFIQGGKVWKEDPNKGQYYSNIVIDKVMVQQKITKDICLFEGNLYPNPDIFGTEQQSHNDDFWNDIKESLSSEKNLTDTKDLTKPSDAEVLTTTFRKEEINIEEQSYLLHYPMGVKEQRINDGTIQPAGIHTMPTEGGSSGGPIFSKDTNDLLGIHIAAKGKLIGEELKATNYFFESFSSQDYNELIKGRNLYAADKDLLREIWKFSH